MANSVDPDQTAPSGAVWSGPTQFAYVILSDTLVFKILGLTSNIAPDKANFLTEKYWYSFLISPWKHRRAGWKIVSLTYKDLTFGRHIVLFFNIMPLSVYTHLPVIEGPQCHFKRSPFLDCPESPPLHVWHHHLTENGFQKWPFPTLGVNGSLIRQEGGCWMNSKPQSSMAAIAMTDMWAGAFSWWNNTPSLNFPRCLTLIFSLNCLRSKA